MYYFFYTPDKVLKLICLSFNNIIDANYFPISILKQGVVVSIFKSSDKLVINKYRPISVFSIGTEWGMLSWIGWITVVAKVRNWEFFGREILMLQIELLK